MSLSEKKSVLILPSWYATPQWPNNGSFFREQALLMADNYEISVAVSEKFWISRQRFLFQKWTSRPLQLPARPLAIQPPEGHTVLYPFCKYASEEENLAAEINSLVYFLSRSAKGLPDLIHAHCSYTAGVMAHGIFKKLHIPFIVTEHTPFFEQHVSPFWLNKCREAIAAAAHVLSVSEFQRQSLLMNDIRRNPTVVGNLADDSLFTIPEKRAGNGKTRLLIVTYYPNFIKDMDTFFAALNILADKGYDQNLECTVVGGGELSGEYGENHYTEIIRKNGWQSFVRVVPSAGRQEMVTLMQETDALVSSSIAESFGVAICEAMLCGKPVITTRNGGINDFADDRNSIRVRVHDAQALAVGILEFMDKKHTFDPEAVRRSVAEKYGRAAFRERIKGIYDSVLQK